MLPPLPAPYTALHTMPAHALPVGSCILPVLVPQPTCLGLCMPALVPACHCPTLPCIFLTATAYLPAGAGFILPAVPAPPGCLFTITTGTWFCLQYAWAVSSYIFTYIPLLLPHFPVTVGHYHLLMPTTTTTLLPNLYWRFRSIPCHH